MYPKAPQKVSESVLRRLLAEAQPYYPRLIFALFLGVVSGLGPLAYVKAFPLILSRVFGDSSHDLPIRVPFSNQVLAVVPHGYILYFVVIALFVVNLVSNAAQYGQSYLTAWSGQRLIASLRVRMFARVLRLPLGEFDKWRPGDFLARFTNDLALMTDAVSISLPQMVQTMVTFVGALAYMIYTDWLLTLFLLIFAPAVNFAVATFTRLISAGTRRAQERIADLASNLT
jgi:ABC-type multidrug transport system fused ATPase/permease subunit